MNVQDFTVTERIDGERRACTDGLRINMTKEYAESLLIILKTELLDKSKHEVDICLFGEIALDY
jgi:hypothetical protein